MKLLVRFLQSKGGWNLGEPKLLVDVIGDSEHSHFSDECLKAAIKSLFRMTENTWLFTEGYGTKFNKTVGRGVAELCAECNRIENSECNVRVTSIGICHWNCIVNRENIEQGLPYDYRESQNDFKKNRMTIEANNTHFIGVDGKAFSGNTLRQVLFKTFPVPRATLLVGGGKKTMNNMVECLYVGIPCIVIEDSGGLASLLASVIRVLKASNRPIDEKQIDATLSQMSKQKGVGIDPKAENFRRCVEKYDHFVLCTARDFQKKEIQELLLRRHLELDQKFRPETFRADLLKLCDSWNCLSLAMDALRSFDYLHNNVLIDCLLSYLQSGKVAFVNLLVKYNPNAFEILEPKHFQQLYSGNKIMLRLILVLCEKESADIWGIQQIADDITFIITGKKTGKEGERENPEKFVFDREFHLFLWCILLKHYELAQFFWRRCDFPITNGLIASSLLRSTAKLGITHSESNAARQQEADGYEELASRLLSKCDDRSQARTKFLLLRNMSSRGNMSCLQLATKDDENANFLTNSVCIRHLNDIWLRCGVTDWTKYFGMLFVSFCFIFALLLFFSCIYSHSYVYNVVALSLGAFFAQVFLVGSTLMQQRMWHRSSYQAFRPVNEEEARTDLEKLEGIEKHEANLLLEVGIPADLIFQENLKKKPQVKSS